MNLQKSNFLSEQVTSTSQCLFILTTELPFGVGYLKSDASKYIGIRQNNILTQSILILILSDSNKS